MVASVFSALTHHTTHRACPLRLIDSDYLGRMLPWTHHCSITDPHPFPPATEALSSSSCFFPSESHRHHGDNTVSCTAASSSGFQVPSVSPILSMLYSGTPLLLLLHPFLSVNGLEGLLSAPALRLMSQVCDIGPLLGLSSPVQRHRCSSVPRSQNFIHFLVISTGL